MQRGREFATRKKAEAWAAMASEDADRALAWLKESQETDRLTVGSLAASWLEWQAGRVTARTLTDYRRDVVNWVEPWFGHRAAELVDESDVQKWVDHMAGRLEPKTVADRHMLLHSIYKYGRARSRRLVSHNPCEETELPTRTKKPPKGTTVAEFRAILDASRDRNPDAHDLVLFLGETGWRFSEATALDVRDVEDDGENVWVNVSRVFRLDGAYRPFLAEDAAKTDAAFRRIVMWPESAAMIRRRVVGKRPGDLVFLNSRGRPWSQNTFLRETWPRLMEAAGLVELERKSGKPPRMLGARRPTPHWLRHMHVAVALASGAPMHEVQRRLGHKHYSTTVDRYGGMIGDMTAETVGRAAEIMSGRRSVPGVAPIVRGEVVSPDAPARTAPELG